MNNTQYYSHIKKDEEGNILDKKKIEVHIKGVINQAVNNLVSNINFSYPLSTLKNLIIDICKLHDIGKYTSYFQNYLINNDFSDKRLKQHSRIGSYIIYNKNKSQDEKLALIAYFIVSRHHSNLNDITKDYLFLDSKRIDLEDVFNYQKKNLQPTFKTIQKELPINNLKDLINFPEIGIRRKAKKLFHKNNISIENYYLINYLFSLLTESDKLDASDSIQYLRKPININSVENFINELPFDKLKNEVRKTVIAKLNDKKLLEQKLFTLTAPTGIGKTLISFDFAIKLRSIIKKEKGYQPQIIYALPFINIIEQILNVFNNVLPKQNKLLAHYQFAEDFEPEQPKEISANYYKNLQLIETWQSDVVVTSFVQFLQTLIGNKNKFLKKFHHFAGSIIFLDEVQSIKAKQLPLIGASLYFLTKYLNTRIILMTATKPFVFELANKFILNNENEIAQPIELLANYHEIFQKFNRTKLIPLNLNKKLKDEIEFVALFSTYWTKEKSCLIVCNTVNRSLNVFYQIKSFLDENNFENHIYYLSTNILHLHRLSIIENIRREIKQGLKPIVISTQSIEAGVDLDFDIGFRDLGPLDSIIQVAGRVNRNNDLTRKESPIYLINFGDCHKIYGPIVEDEVKNIFSEHLKGISENKYLDLIENYFTRLYERKSFDEATRYFESMKLLRYDSDIIEDFPISNFRIIDEYEYAKPVFIEIDNRATEVLGKFRQLIHKEISREEFLPYKKDFYQRILKVPKNYLADNTTMLTENIYLLENDLVNQFYNTQTGFIRNNNQEQSSEYFL